MEGCKRRCRCWWEAEKKGGHEEVDRGEKKRRKWRWRGDDGGRWWKGRWRGARRIPARDESVRPWIQKEEFRSEREVVDMKIWRRREAHFLKTLKPASRAPSVSFDTPSTSFAARLPRPMAPLQDHSSRTLSRATSSRSTIQTKFLKMGPSNERDWTTGWIEVDEAEL